MGYLNRVRGTFSHTTQKRHQKLVNRALHLYGLYVCAGGAWHPNLQKFH